MYPSRICLKGPATAGVRYGKGEGLARWRSWGWTYWKGGSWCPALTVGCREGHQESHCAPRPVDAIRVSKECIDREGHQRSGEGRAGGPVVADGLQHGMDEGGEGEGVRRRTCLSCNSALLRTSASASKVAIMQLLMAAASMLGTSCRPGHTEVLQLIASRQKGGLTAKRMFVVVVEIVRQPEDGNRCWYFLAGQGCWLGQRGPMVRGSPSSTQ